MIECLREIEEWHTYQYSKDGEPLVLAKWCKRGNVAEAHNHMYQSTKSALLESRRLLSEEVMPDMYRHGCSLLVVTDKNENVDATRLKYWRFMGFTVTGCTHGYTFAVMEITCPQYQ